MQANCWEHCESSLQHTDYTTINQEIA